MEWFWYFLTVILDVFPFVLFQYLPFKNKLRFSWSRTMLLCAAVLLSQQLLLVYISTLPLYTLNIMLFSRFSQLITLLVLTFVLINDSYAKSLFVFGLMFPFMMLLMSVACFFVPYLPAAPAYMWASLLRLGLTAVTFPLALFLWQRYFIPIMQQREDIVWQYAWPLPTAFSLISLFYTENDFELVGVSLPEVLGRLAIFAGSAAICIMLNKMLEHYYAYAVGRDILQLELSLDIPESSAICDIDMCIIIGNLLENAIEAQQFVPEENRKISIKAHRSDHRLYIIVRNTCAGVLKSQEGMYLSRKRDYKTVGVGLSSVNAIVKKYDGELRIENDREHFCVYLMLRESSNNSDCSMV